MKKITANVICPWFDGQVFGHALAGNTSSGKIIRQKTWTGDVLILEKNDESAELHFNRPKEEQYDYVIDLGTLFSLQSSQVQPSRRILALTEPSAWLELTNEKVTKMDAYYQGLILGWHNVLRGLRQYKFWNATFRWVSETKLDKQFGISGFISNKSRLNCDGYKLRYDVLLRQDEIHIPSIVWNFTGTWQGHKFMYPLPSKNEGMGWMFHLAMENIQEPGYFTEKIVDCFVMRTVPVYFGAPDIGDFFDLGGIIQVNLDNWLEKINCLTIADYIERLDVIEVNFQRSQQYWSAIDKLASIISRLDRPET